MCLKTSLYSLSQSMEEHVSNLLSRVLKWHQVLQSNTPSRHTEHHIHYYNISLPYQPTRLLPSSREDLCWPPVGKKQVYPNHWFLPASAKRRRVGTYFLVHGLEKVPAPLCLEAKIKLERILCHSHLPGLSLQRSARLGNVFESWIEGSVISAQSSTKIRGVWGTDRSG